MEKNADKREAPSYPGAQCVLMEVMLSKHNNNIAPAATSFKTESNFCNAAMKT